MLKSSFGFKNRFQSMSSIKYNSTTHRKHYLISNKCFSKFCYSTKLQTSNKALKLGFDILGLAISWSIQIRNIDKVIYLVIPCKNSPY